MSEIGGWGGAVFNGGAWLEIEDRRADVHYRDLNVVEHELAEARHGRIRNTRSFGAKLHRLFGAIGPTSP
ncbi:hypothetical protein [Arthrobacter sp. ISL-30]|uniref:hypothetical protein n=1 Tax=Arthrobacter sp. ISL-30 TaxID=2819109 RepID=UPI001BE750F8|nr:hypothetical protein [Arthrobacter sp. ISL-30]MBT2514615.1 hypothetical protein [Arthrobacter sp. ISL-30]